MRIIIIFWIQICMVINCFGQSETVSKDSQANYDKAEIAYSEGNYSSAIELLKRIKKISGATNSRIQQLLVKSYRNFNQNELAMDALKEYFAISKETDGYFREMIQFKKSLNEENETYSEEEYQAYMKVKYQKEVEYANIYLDKYPFGKYASEVKTIKRNSLKKNKDSYMELISVYRKNLEISNKKRSNSNFLGFLGVSLVGSGGYLAYKELKDKETGMNGTTTGMNGTTEMNTEEDSEKYLYAGIGGAVTGLIFIGISSKARKKSNFFAQKAEEYKIKAGEIDISFNPVIAPEKKLYGMNIVMNF